ncbi:hypothetical protein H0X32_00040 [Patescibacteria group bacterium]|nr:hypothetical protein [Patescibacteria group bacterium]
MRYSVGGKEVPMILKNCFRAATGVLGLALLGTVGLFLCALAPLLVSRDDLSAAGVLWK